MGGIDGGRIWGRVTDPLYLDRLSREDVNHVARVEPCPCLRRHEFRGARPGDDFPDRNRHRPLPLPLVLPTLLPPLPLVPLLSASTPTIPAPKPLPVPA